MNMLSIKKMVLLVVSVTSLISSLSQAQLVPGPSHGNQNSGYNQPPNNGYYSDNAQRTCLNAAYRYQSYGYSIDPYSWCSGVRTMGVAVCREAGLDYKLRGGYLPNVKDWCADVRTDSEGRCRSLGLDQKIRTGYPVSVKDYCR